MKKILCVVIMSAGLFYVSCGRAQASEEVKANTPAVAAAEPVVVPETAKDAGAGVKYAPVPVKKNEMSKKDMVARVEEMCRHHPDMIVSIPGLVMKEVEGKKVYEFNGKRLEDLDEDSITNLIRGFNQFISLQNTQRFERQMKAIKQIDDINRMQRSLKKPYIPSMPKTYNPPKPYKPPARPYRAPGK